MPDNSPVLTSAADRSMLEGHYQQDRDGARHEPAVWCTVTPAVLLVRRTGGRSGGSARIENEAAARAAVRDALRHAEVSARCEALRVQREPFTARGARAEDFAPGTRFETHRLWHVEIAFAEPVAGPLVIGDGRFLGVGLMAPVKRAPGARRWRLSIDAQRPVPVGETLTFAEAVRSALMGRWRADRSEDLPSWLSGHRGNGDGGALREGAPAHLFIAPSDLDGDSFIDAVQVMAPPALSEREARQVGALVRRLRVIDRNGVRLAVVSAVAADAPRRARSGEARRPMWRRAFPGNAILQSSLRPMSCANAFE